ncbi:hypothetical protein [Sulfitobacter aestuariivivens]|uniref:Uncharacterized protein n=1 Tax=Sulfitobacter aestuariivivens TaxID=2766981 RepID=A0A927D007_9RHOB|nr:hypothetical protein [Sulfitobacter aestuariivivens]MBD3662535.1 hypothetical protein [Sulfitobacter aestuariivivens]
MPRIVRFYIMHCIIGFAIAAAFVAALLWTNTANLWHLISTSDIGVMAVVVFWVLNGIVFAGVQSAIAIMLLAERKDKGPKGGAGISAAVPAKAQVADIQGSR